MDYTQFYKNECQILIKIKENFKTIEAGRIRN